MRADIAKLLKPVIQKGDVLLDTEATAKNILHARLALEIQQKVLALEMGVSQSYLHDLENGKRRITMKLFTLAKAGLEKLSNA